MISTIFKWPFAIVILRVLAAVALSLIIALIYFSPKITELEENISNIKQAIDIVDRELKQHQTYIKALKQHQSLKELNSQLNSVNAINRNLLQTILDIKKTDNSFTSLESLNHRSFSIKLQVNNWNHFYAFAENIEKMPITDSIRINRDIENMELILRTGRYSGSNQ